MQTVVQQLLRAGSHGRRHRHGSGALLHVWCVRPWALANVACRARVLSPLAPTGFVLLFTRHEPVPRPLRRAFHLFGLVTALVAIVTTVVVQAAGDCEVSTKALYRFCRASGYTGVAFTGTCAHTDACIPGGDGRGWR